MIVIASKVEASNRNGGDVKTALRRWFRLWADSTGSFCASSRSSRSAKRPLPKDRDARDVTVVSELRLLLGAAMKASPSEHVFARGDGSPYTPDVRFRLVDHPPFAVSTPPGTDG